jgi:hypothetical protein
MVIVHHEDAVIRVDCDQGPLRRIGRAARDITEARDGRKALEFDMILTRLKILDCVVPDLG